LLIMGGNLFGTAAPIVTGYVVAATGGYSGAFAIAGVLLLGGARSSISGARSPIRLEAAPTARHNTAQPQRFDGVIQMQKLVFAAVSRNYFNMPIWIAQHQGMFADEGLDVAIELYEGVDEVTNRLRDGGPSLPTAFTEHVILDSEAGGSLEIIGAMSTGCRFPSSPAKPSRRSRIWRQDRGRLFARCGQFISGDENCCLRGDWNIRATTRCGLWDRFLARWELLQSGEIDAGLQGAPLNYIALDQASPVCATATGSPVLSIHFAECG